VYHSGTVGAALTARNGLISGIAVSQAVTGFGVEADGPKKTLKVDLKYYEGKPVIELLQRVSRPSLRKYKKSEDILKVKSGLGTAIVSTSKGLMTDKTAREQGIGGEVLCIVA
jgi:small subunit ribosomal protein S8